MTLGQPPICSVTLLAHVIAERQAGANAALFTGWAAEWRQRVQVYLQHGGSPDQVPTWPQIAGHAGTFQRLYTHARPGSTQRTVLDQLRGHGLDLCPACGEAGAPQTLDHYLPKGRYPEFSIEPANLFPMCDACQGAKKEKTGDAAGRYFIHPYFDTFSRPQIVSVSITPPYDSPGFLLAPHPELEVVEAVLVGSHLRELDIHERYVVFFRNEHRRLLRNVSAMRASGQDVIQTLGGFMAGFAYPTLNSWQHVFYDGVLSNSDLCRYLATEQLPLLL